MSQPTTVTTGRLRFTPTCPGSCSNPNTGRHHHAGQWQKWWGGLSEAQRDELRAKASWEHMTLSAVAREWGVSTTPKTYERG